MNEVNDYGIVYVLTNPVMPGLVKIGMTTRNDIEARMRELYGTGVPVPFECKYACKIKTIECLKIERALHKAFSSFRINVNREFFSINPEQVIAILELFNQEDITAEVRYELNEDLTSDDKIAQEKVRWIRRPSLNFKEMGIKPGSVLTFTEKPEIQVSVVNDRKISYQGEETSLTAVTRKVLDIEYNVQPTGYWTFDGKNLKEIYEETYFFSDES